MRFDRVGRPPLKSEHSEYMQSAKPLVSVIIPCFNAEECVAEAIASALGQSYRPVEVIVVDDGSTDASLAKIQTFGQDVILYSGPNEGGCAARNRGLALSHGELIQFLDADDLLYPEKLERQISAMGAEADEVTYCDWREETKGKQRVLSPQYFPGDSVLTNVVGTLQTSSVLHRSTLLKAVGGFRVGLRCAQERELHLRMACHSVKFRHVPEELYVVRRREGSVGWDRGKVAAVSCGIDFEWFNYLESNGQLTEPRRRAFAAVLARKARWLMADGKAPLARGWFAKAQAIHPTGWRDAYGRREALLFRIAGFRGTEALLQAALGLEERLGRRLFSRKAAARIDAARR